VAVAASLTAWFVAADRVHFSLQPLDAARRIAFAGAYALAAWSWCFACIGAAVRFLGQPSARLRYLSDASYWMYLVHLPLIWLLQAWMLRWPLHWTLKFPLVLAIAMALLLASYHWLVRNTFVGVFLNGRRHPRLPAAAAIIPAPNISPG
jgi:peptidoglycan/LPS O-acetylase OafA/YrhL